MRPDLAFFVLFVSGLAGCASSGDDANLAAVVPRGDPELLPLEREVAGAVVWHEEPHFTARLLTSDTLVIANEWEPRDVNLTYHGIQSIYDEWARPVDAHVFRYPEMELQATDIELQDGFPSVRITAEWTPGLVEFAFDATDGRFLGYADIEHQMRTFSDPRWREPLSFSYARSTMLGIAYDALGGDLSKGIPTWGGNITLNETATRPLEGDCQAYEYGFTPLPWYKEWMEESGVAGEGVPAAERQRDIVCLGDHGAPLWSFRGNETDHIALTRESQHLTIPGLVGEPLEPPAVARKPLDDLPMLLGVAGPIAVPPSQYPGDWADIIRPVVQGLATGVDYLEFSLTAESEHLEFIMKGWPAYGSILNLPLVNELLPWDEESWVWSADGARMFWGFVNSRYGSPEDPDLHYSDRGVTFDDYPTRPEDLVASGEVQGFWGGFLPETPRLLSYSSFPDLFDDFPPEVYAYLEPFLTTWHEFEFCFEPKDDGRFGIFSAVTGQMLALGGQESYGTATAGGCSSGMASAGASGGGALFRVPSAGGDLLLRPAYGGEPGVLLLPRGPSGRIVPDYEVLVLGRPAPR